MEKMFSQKFECIEPKDFALCFNDNAKNSILNIWNEDKMQVGKNQEASSITLLILL